MFRLLLSLLVTSQLASAAEIIVKPAPEQSSKSVITDAIKKAANGDTILLSKGVYYENIKVVEKTITLKGEDGVIIDGTTPLSATWEAAGDDMPGVYQTEMKDRPYGLFVDGKIIASLRYDRAKKEGDWHWRKLLAKGTPKSGFDNIRALWIYNPEEQRMYVRLEESADPNQAKLSYIKKDRPLLLLENANNCTVENITFQGGERAIVIEGKAATGNTIRKCQILSFEERGIIITDEASNNLITENEITRGSLEEWTPSLKHDRANYEIWLIHKEVGNYDRVGVDIIKAGTDNKVTNNHIHLVFDGVTIGDYSAESLSKPLPDPNHGKGTVISGNIIENTRDSGIELGVGCIDVQVHDNTLRRTHGGLRFKLPRIGPVFIYRNQLIDGSPFNIWHSMDKSLAEGYIYHNTFAGRKPAMASNLKDKDLDSVAPNWHFINNLILTEEGFFEDGGNADTKKFTYKNNLAVKTDGHTDNIQIPAEAIDQAMDLSTYFHGKPLPGFAEKNFKGKAADIGAVETDHP